MNVLKFSNNTSTILFNGFTVLSYTSPFLGSIFADGYIGKFKQVIYFMFLYFIFCRTIFFVSILYAFGQILLAFASTFNSESVFHPYLDLVGLSIIGIGTGGIKVILNFNLIW